MDYCTDQFDIARWQDGPVIKGRVATAADAAACIAAFAVPDGRSQVYDGGDLPARAVLMGTEVGVPAGTEVIVVQIERTTDGTMIIMGFINPQGGMGVGLLSDLRIVERPANTR